MFSIYQTRVRVRDVQHLPDARPRAPRLRAGAT
jgi:hypothetical protein